MGRLDVRHPVAHRLVDGVLERRRAGRHRADLGAERAHPEHVRRLALDVLGAHVDDARQVEQGAGRRGRDAVLAGAGLGDDPGLAEPPGEQRLAERVVDLVGAGVGEVLALEVEAEPCAGSAGRGRLARAGSPASSDRVRRGGRRGRGPSGGRRTGRAARAARPRRAGPGGARRTRSRAARARPSASRGRSGRRSRAPSPSGRRRRRRAGRGGRASGRTARFGRSSRAARARFTNSATRSGSLRGRSPGDARALRRRTRRRRRRPGSRGARRRRCAGSRPPASDDRHLAGDGGGERGVGARAGAAGVRAAGGVEEEPLGAGGEEGSRPRATTRRRRRRGLGRERGAPSRPAGRRAATSARSARRR